VNISFVCCIFLAAIVIGSAELHAIDSSMPFVAIQHSGTTANLSSVVFVNQEKGWAVGEGGTIIYTTDGGNHWLTQTNAMSTNLMSVDFVDEKHGWAVGKQGTVIHTRDGGNTWVHDKLITDQDLWDLSFLTPTRGWAVGSGGTILQLRN